MNFARTLFAAALGIAVFTFQPQAEANQGLVLTDDVKQALIGAKPISNRNVDRETFDGKPVLVTFFASW